MLIHRFGIFLLLNSMLCSCMVGPDFRSPPPPTPKRYTYSPLPKHTASLPGKTNYGKKQNFNMGEDLPAEWWKLFHSKELNSLIVAGIENNPTLAAAKWTLRQAQENLRAQFGLLMLPNVNTQLSGQRERFSGEQFGTSTSSLFNLYNASINVGYTLDIFGGARRQVEAYRAQVDFEGFEFIGSYLTLTSNIATTAISIAGIEAELKATRSLVAAETRQLEIFKKQFRLGAIALPDLLLQQTQIDQTRSLIPPLEKNLEQGKNALAVLIGALPSEVKLPNIVLNQLNLPKDLPLSIPSLLVKQRPDVQAAEALLHVASAQIGVATANLFPSFTITGSYGWSSSMPSHLFNPNTNFWNYGINIAQPIFQGGALLAQRRAAMDAYNVALAQYRQTVLTAFQNVADALRAIETDARELEILRDAELSSKKNYDLTNRQFFLGGTSFLTLLIVQQQYQQAVINRIRAEAIRYNDTVALFQALGGGWWNTSIFCNVPVNV